MGSMDPLRWPVGSWGARPPPRPVQTLAVACGEEKFAIAVWPRGLAMRFAKFITPKAGASVCGGLWGLGANAHPQGRCKRLRWPVRFAEERDAGMGGPKVNLTFNPLAKLHPVKVSVGLGQKDSIQE